MEVLTEPRTCAYIGHRHKEKIKYYFILPNVHSIKMTPKMYCYNHRSIHFSILIKEPSFCNSWQLTRRATTGQHAENKRINECISHTPPLVTQGSQ